MNALIVLTFLIPGFVIEFLRELITKEKLKRIEDPWLFKILRGLWYNVPMNIYVWVVIWFWKVPLGHDWYMIQSLEEFWAKCCTEVFMMRYVLVIFVGVILYAIGFWIYRKCIWFRRLVPCRPPRPPRPPRCHD